MDNFIAGSSIVKIFLRNIFSIVFSISIIPIVFFSCHTDNSNAEQLGTILEPINKAECYRRTKFGDKSICLPKVEGMVECYSNPTVKKRTDETTNKNNTILGVYILDDIFNSLSENEGVFFNNWIRVMSFENFKYKKSDYKDIDHFLKLMTKDFQQGDIKGILERLKKKHKVLFDIPILLESSSPHKNIRSALFVSRISKEGDDNTLVGSMNACLINERVIFFLCYQLYTDDNTIQDVKSRSFYFGLSLLDANK